ncbi:MAG: hypothetical protein DMD79_22925 [Candidatus Rokuibacteriota bacterium]|jgi:hypothetical protein|nr:MAG: hypothetical protein DMD79_22925 [Candidatus Rokubacteria bacterium]
MRGRTEIAARFADTVLRRLITRRFVEVRDEARVKTALQRVIIENLEAEEALDADARRLLQEHARDIREKGLDYRQLLTRAKEKLARDRGFIL